MNPAEVALVTLAMVFYAALALALLAAAHHERRHAAAWYRHAAAWYYRTPVDLDAADGLTPTLPPSGEPTASLTARPGHRDTRGRA